MAKTCYLCGDEFKADELVELTVIAPWRKIRSEVAYCVGKPIDAYPDTLRHHRCPSGDYENAQI